MDLLTPDKRLESTRFISDREYKRLELQTDFDNNTDIENRKKLGQFATPPSLANEIMEYALSILKSNEIIFLEPSVGTGSFISSFYKNAHNKIIKDAIGYDIDKNLVNISLSLWSSFGLKVIHGDFTKEKPIQNKVNLLISNPPYVRHHDIFQDDKLRLQKAVLNELNIKPSGLTPLYCYFMYLSHKWLSKGAISGWLIPSEFMDVNYGKELKEYLLNKVTLLRIHRYDPSNPLFNDALVSSCVVWFKNEEPLDDYEVEFSYGTSHTDSEVTKKISKKDLLKEDKWTRFPLQDVRSEEGKNNFCLGDFFEIKRGIATGDNNYFILNENQIKEKQLDINDFIPVLPPPRIMKKDIVEEDDEGKLVLDNRLYLLNCSLSEEEIKNTKPFLYDYLQKGKNTTGKKYLCKHRKVWYLQEKREPAPILCTYMGKSTDKRKSPFRFILNKSKAVATNSYLMLYPKKEIKDLRVLEDIWNTLKNITSLDIENEGRVYGGGLKKIEPKELAKVPCNELSNFFK